MDVGVLLPHFGSLCSRGDVIRSATRAEELGFDSLWVRDHLYIPPFNREHGGIVEERFLEAIQTLTFVSAITSEIALGTSVANPHRHPLKLSQNLGTLNYLHPGRVICGLGAGSHRGEFDAVGVPFERRGSVAEEMMEILKGTFTGTDVDYQGEYFSFENVTINPRAGDGVPIWYGGKSLAAMRRVVEYADGWNIGRPPFDRFATLYERFNAISGPSVEGTTICSFPIYSIAERAEDAYEEIDTEAFIRDANKSWNTAYTRKEEVEGSLVAGTAEDIAEAFEQFENLSIDHVILDMRHSPDRIIDMMELTADDVLPAV